MTAKQKPAPAEPAEVVRRDEKSQCFQPATDIVETDDAAILAFDMPGVCKDDVDITVDNDTLTVTGRAEPEESGKAVYRETYVGDYRRQFTLSNDLDAANVTAQMVNGVLTVTVGKAAQAKPRKVQITAG